MDPELLELLSRLNDQDNPLSDEELTTLRSTIAQIIGDIDRTNPTSDDLEVIREGAQNIRAIDAEVDRRAEEAAGRAAEAEAALEGIDLGTAETPAEEVPEEPAPEPAPEEPAPEEGATETVETPEPEAVPEPVAAAATPQLPRISALARRTPVSHRPVPTATEQPRQTVLTASADVPGLTIGQEMDMLTLGKAVQRKAAALANARLPEGSEMVYLAHAEIEYPEDRTLRMDSGDDEKLERSEALVAAGGVCGPVDVDYDIQGVSTADRPVRDGLDRFNAARGGLRYVRPATLASVNAKGGQTLWTNTNDSAITSPATKAVATYTCPTVVEEYVDAVVSRSRFGNFNAKFAPEQVDQILETARADHARLAEATLLATISTHTSTENATVAGEILGAVSDWFASLDRAAAAIRYRNRMARNAPLRVIYPSLLIDMLRADMAREMPGATFQERIAITEAQLNAGYAARNINASITLDSFTGASPLQGFVPQGNGMLVPWPDSIFAWIFPEGSWTFLDGGTLDFGMYRDSTLNNTNDVEFFMETFEKAVFRGVASIELKIDICPSGARSALEDTSNYCLYGS